MAYGAKYVGSLQTIGVEPMTRKFLVTAGTTITKNDIVSLSSGKLIVATAGTKIAGVAHETVLGNAAGTTTCEIIVPRDGDMYLMDNDNAVTTFGITYVGTYFDIVGTTGIMQVDTSTTTTTGQLLAVEYNPQGFGVDSDTSQGLFCIAESIFHGRTA